MGGLLGGPKGMLPPPSQIIGGPGPPWPPLFLRLCPLASEEKSFGIVDRRRTTVARGYNALSSSGVLGSREQKKIIGVGRGGARGGGGPGPPNNLRGGANIPFGPPNNPPTCTSKTIPLNSILEFSIISYFKMRNVIIWH